MADSPGTEPVTTNGVSPAGIAASRAATLAKLVAGEDKAEKSKAEPEKKAAEPEPTADKVDAKEPDAKPDEDEADSEDKDTEETSSAKDPDLEKRLAQVHKVSKREKEQLAKERADFHDEVSRVKSRLESEWAPRIKAAEEFAQLKTQARTRPLDVLKALGFGDDDWEDLSRAAYAESPAGQKDPRYKADASKRLRDRELYDKLGATERKLAEFEAKQAERERLAELEHQTSAYLDHAVKAAGADHPLVKQMLDKNAGKARAALWRAAEAMFNRDGDMPDVTDVVKELEKNRRAELEELGVDVSSIAKAPTKAVETKKTEAKKVDADSKDRPRTMRERREDTLRKLERGELD